MIADEEIGGEKLSPHCSLHAALSIAEHAQPNATRGQIFFWAYVLIKSWNSPDAMTTDEWQQLAQFLHLKPAQ